MAQIPQLHAGHIQEILLAYAFTLRGFAPLKGGNNNTNYRVATPDHEFVLTIFEIGLEQVTRLANLLLYLENYDFPTTRIQKTDSGALHTTFRGKPVLLKTFIPGQIVEVLSEPMLVQTGLAMARLHAIPAPEFLPGRYTCGLHTFPGLFGQGIDPAYETWLEERYQYFTKYVSIPLPSGLIHGDIFFDNVLFSGKNFKAMIDFEDACRHYFAFDLGMAIVGLCAAGERIDLAQARSLLAGYQKLRELGSAEKYSLQMFVEYAAVATSSWRFWRYNIDMPEEDKANHHWQMANLAKHVSAVPRERFLRAVFG